MEGCVDEDVNERSVIHYPILTVSVLKPSCLALSCGRQAVPKGLSSTFRTSTRTGTKSLNPRL